MLFLVRAILKNIKFQKLKKDLLRPTKIYSDEILRLINRNLISSAAHITGGGLIENLSRSIPNYLSIHVDLSKNQKKRIFKWLKSKNISDSEMLKTFNCGVGFCIMTPKKNIETIKKNFENDYMPYEIGFVSTSKKKINLLNAIKW